MSDVRVRRILEAIPGILSWTILLSPFFLVLLAPSWVATIYVIFCLFWLFRSLSYALHLVESYFNYKKISTIPWEQALSTNNECFLNNVLKRFSMSFDTNKKQIHLESEDIHHMIVLAMYNEPYEILFDTITSLSVSNFNLKHIHLVLATEGRKQEHATAVAVKLLKDFSGVFGSFTHAMHPANLPDEIPGKGANISYAAKEAVDVLFTNATIPAFPSQEHVVVTSLDADNKVHPNYFAVLSHFYAHAEDRQHYSYQPLPFVYNNIWSVPVFNRVVAISSTFWHFIESGRNDRLRNFSSHAQPLQALVHMDFWSKTTIVEDGHQFWRSYLHYKGQYKVLPIFIPIYQDAVENESYHMSLVGQYKQLRRWAFGAEDIAFMIQIYWKHRKELPMMISMYHFASLIEGHLMWSTAPFLLTISGSLFSMFNPAFTETAMFFNFSYLLSLLFTISIVGIIVSISLSFLTLPPIPEHYQGGKRMMLWLSIFFQWLLLPIVTIVFASLPALEAQTRLMIGNKLGFEVTKKVR